ncbi:putative peptidoglycan binding protein [Brevirhabdus pacifica]|nr:putative peptidoglycan binding protein [Brevirhabdus pacifica]
MMTHASKTGLFLALGLAAGCDGPGRTTAFVEGIAPIVSRSRDSVGEAGLILRPEGAAPDSCWTRDVEPAIIESVTEQVVVQPPEIGSDGGVRAPGIYHTETHQRIVRPRRESWFQIPCPDQMTPAFVASLQRALQARGLYTGAVTGQMDVETRRAVRRFQTQRGAETAEITLDGARALGLSPDDFGPRPGAEG